MNKLISLIFCFISTITYSEVYKCEINNVATFSQLPCSDNAEKIIIKTAPENKSSELKLSTKEDINDIDTFIKLRLNQKKISVSKQLIKTYQTNMFNEIKKLEPLNHQTANTLYAATHAEAIVEQSKSITAKSNVLIAIEESKIDRITLQNERLRKLRQHNQVIDNLSANTSTTENYIQLREINTNIKNHQGKVIHFKDRMESELITLRQQFNSASKSLEGANWQKSLAKQMTAVTEKYHSQIQVEQRQIDRLINSKVSLIN